MIKKADDHPGHEKRSRHIRFIQANFDQLAAMAYKGFLEKGKGMLVLDEQDFAEKPIGVLVKFRAGYVAEGSQEFKAMGEKWPGDGKEAGWVKEYDPARSVLFCFSRKDGGVSSYRVHGVPGHSPLECYGRSRGKMN